MNYFQRRNLLKSGREMLRHARHFRNMHEDLLKADQLQSLATSEGALAKACGDRDLKAIPEAQDALAACINGLAPKRSHPGLRENLEVFAVAVAVAMSFRTYFLQPFKIPTGSMEPTLYGIQIQNDVQPGFMDRFPVKLIKWASTGSWYTEVRAKADGYISAEMPYLRQGDGTTVDLYIGGLAHKIPAKAVLRIRPQEYVKKGTVIWSGMRTAGDHVLVDKVRWNFRMPRRGEVMVFATDGISALQQGTHYIKRMCGLPGETVSINPPNLVIDGKVVTEPSSIKRIESLTPGYKGYTLIDPRTMGQDECYLVRSDSQLRLKAGEYAAFGDNTTNSRDSRYWGAVPQSNLVGPACAVYWPFSSRWGAITR